MGMGAVTGQKGTFDVSRVYRMITSYAGGKRDGAQIQKQFEIDNDRAKFRRMTDVSGGLQAKRHGGVEGYLPKREEKVSPRVSLLANCLSTGTPRPEHGKLLSTVVQNSMKPRGQWKREELVDLFALLQERNAPILTHRYFRDELDRDGNLYTNQIVREANGKVAYRTVEDLDPVTMSDEEFWAGYDRSSYRQELDRNAIFAMLQMKEKLGIS